MEQEKTKVRCAAYCRKSVEDGLEMDFNSLDAQREACENYIASQKANGWVCLPQHYDDGGFSGGNMNRPALQQLREDIEAGKVDMIIVYKLDRLTRSLMDFSDLQEFFDAHNVSFVSVTQEINTSTSAGRMMLNILMTFAQYEREIIGERIRDKVAASKKRGIFMGGNIPFGYDLRDRRLYINAEQAKTVKWIFRRFQETGSPRQIAAELNAKGIVDRRGRIWNAPHIARMIGNRTYAGQVAHKGNIYAGEQEAIITPETWERCHEIVVSQTPRILADGQRKTVTPLRGILKCGHCHCAMKPTFVKKGNKRYYYYDCDQDTKRGKKSCPVGRIASETIEDAVRQQAKKIFTTEYFLEQIAMSSDVPAKELEEIFTESFWQEATPREQNLIYKDLFETITVKKDQIEFEVKSSGIKKLIEGIKKNGNH